MQLGRKLRMPQAEQGSQDCDLKIFNISVEFASKKQNKEWEYGKGSLSWTAFCFDSLLTKCV